MIIAESYTIRRPGTDRGPFDLPSNALPTELSTFECQCLSLCKTPLKHMREKLTKNEHAGLFREFYPGNTDPK